MKTTTDAAKVLLENGFTFEEVAQLLRPSKVELPPAMAGLIGTTDTTPRINVNPPPYIGTPFPSPFRSSAWWSISPDPRNGLTPQKEYRTTLSGTSESLLD
jgi:hypothetical protein